MIPSSVTARAVRRAMLFAMAGICAQRDARVLPRAKCEIGTDESASECR